MRKISPQFQSGIEYIQLSRLPFEQLNSFRSWICETDRFILTDHEGEKHECAYYDIYDFWFDTFKEEKGEIEFSLF